MATRLFLVFCTSMVAFLEASADVNSIFSNVTEQGARIYKLSVTEWDSLGYSYIFLERNADSCIDCHRDGSRAFIKQKGVVKYKNIPAMVVGTYLSSFGEVCFFKQLSIDKKCEADIEIAWNDVELLVESVNLKLVYPKVLVDSSEVQNVELRITPSLNGIFHLENVIDPLEYKFGLDANHKSLSSIIVAALFGEMGMDDSFPPDNQLVHWLQRYLHTFNGWDEVPNTETFEIGLRLFSDIGCSSCHKQTIDVFEDGKLHTLNPFSDFKAYDLGYWTVTGEVQRNWRTAPLWGVRSSINLEDDASGYLHDGRARSLKEAIAWHGGQARQARSNFFSLSSDKQQLIIRFLRDL